MLSTLLIVVLSRPIRNEFLSKCFIFLQCMMRFFLLFLFILQQFQNKSRILHVG